MKIDVATKQDVYEAALHMRDSDYREFSALSWAHDRETLARDLAGRPSPSRPIVARMNDRPVAVGDVLEIRPNVLTLYFFATDDFPRIALQLTRFLRYRLLGPLMLTAHRVEAASMVGHDTAHRWIRFLGLSEEAVLRGYGKNGEDFVQFAWVKDAGKTGPTDR